MTGAKAWIAEKCHAMGRWWLVRDGDSEFLVTGLTEEQARLIAAAPDMLEALQGLVALYCELAESGDAGNWDPETEGPVIMARRAIGMATGAPSPMTSAEQPK